MSKKGGRTTITPLKGYLYVFEVIEYYAYLSIGLSCAVSLAKLKIVEIASSNSHRTAVSEEEREKRFEDQVFQCEDDAHRGQPALLGIYQYQ